MLKLQTSRNASIATVRDSPDQGNADEVVPQTMSASPTKPGDFSSSLDDILSSYRTHPTSPVSEAAGIPLPGSPAPASPPPADDPDSDELNQTSYSQVTASKGRVSRSSSKTFDTEDIPQSINQELERVEPLKSRAPTMAPGAYPESESPEETPVQTPRGSSEEPTSERSSQAADTEDSRTNGSQPRKSVSIALPETDACVDMPNCKLTGNTTEQFETHNNKTNEPELQYKKVSEEPKSEAECGTLDAQTDRQKLGTEGNDETISLQDTDIGSERKSSLKPRQTFNRNEASPVESLNSSVLSELNADKPGVASLHEHESLVASDADTSSLKPLLASPNMESTSSEMVSLQDDDRSVDNGRALNSPVKEPQEPNMESRVVSDDLYSLSTITSSRSSAEQEEDKNQASAFPFPVLKPSERNASDTATSLPPPKITVEEATEVDESPGPPVPDSTPVQQTTPKRRTSFLPLGESPEPRKAVKLPMKRSKRYVRKARQTILRQPILDALLGRQMGAQVKPALKRLADGEFVVIELSASP